MRIARENATGRLRWRSPLGAAPLGLVLRNLLLYKAGFALVVCCGLDLWPAYSSLGHQAHLHWPVSGPETWQSRLATWDAAHYLHLARDWYVANDKSCAFYPLWPLLIRVVTPIAFGNGFVAGLLLSNLLSIVGLCLFFRLVEKAHGREVASVSLVVFLAFPGALFFSFIYTEGLFLLLVMLFFLGLREQRLWLACLSGFLLPMTRAVGVFVLLPLAWQLVEEGWRRWRQSRSSAPGVRPVASIFAWLPRQRHLLAVLAVLAGYGSYLGIMSAATGNPFEGFEAQKHYPNQPSIGNILNIPGFLRAFVNIGGLHGMADSAIDRALFVLFLATLPSMWRLDRRYFFYALGSGLVPAMSNWFLSYDRFLMMCFPVFIVLGHWLIGPEKRWMVCYYVAIAGAVQVMLLIRHINFFWAG